MAKGKLSEFKRTKHLSSGDSIRIKRGPREKSITGSVTVISFRDKDTNQVVTYIPTLDISGYGENESKAIEMMRFSVTEFFDYLVELPVTKMATELKKLGWKHNPLLKAKEYSNTYIDIRGELQNFNAVDNKVQVSLLSV
jgi:hypothetical protein